MKVQSGSVIFLFTLACLGVFLLGTSRVPAEAAAPRTVNLTPNSNIHSAVDASPPGSTFVLRAGIYRMQSVTPKRNDVFIGQGPGVVFKGSILLKFRPALTSNKLWVAFAAATPSSNESNRYYKVDCDRNHPLCAYTQDLFVDGQLQTPVSGLASLRPGQWFFDRASNIVFLPTNPQGHVVELGMMPYAFSGPANGVTIRNLIVEEYASWAQRGAIGGDLSSLGTSWKVDKVEARLNHGAGIGLGSNSQILNSFIHHNGQLGVAAHGSNSKVIGNEISWNNLAGFRTDWEAGGGKFCETIGLVVQSNYVHDNYGTGLWTDIDAIDTLYEKNTVINNKKIGIQHEISFGANIRDNIVKGNGSEPTVWLWNAQILVQNSSNVQVYGNTVEVPAGYGNGIGIVNQERGSGAHGPRLAKNNSVHDNTITHLGSSGYSGFVDDTGDRLAIGNVFDHNRYVLQQTDNVHWTWLHIKTWAQFRALGQESHGSCCK